MDRKEINTIDLLHEVDAAIITICKKIQGDEFAIGDFSYAVDALPKLLAARATLALSV